MRRAARRIRYGAFDSGERGLGLGAYETPMNPSDNCNCTIMRDRFICSHFAFARLSKIALKPHKQRRLFKLVPVVGLEPTRLFIVPGF